MPRVLVTGCGGFVGRVLVGTLSQNGYDVWGIDRTETEETFAGSQRLVGDLLDADAVADLLARAEPDFIVHLAAQSSVRRSFDEPRETIRSNTIPALHLLDYMRDGAKTRIQRSL